MTRTKQKNWWYENALGQNKTWWRAIGMEDSTSSSSATRIIVFYAKHFADWMICVKHWCNIFFVVVVVYMHLYVVLVRDRIEAMKRYQICHLVGTCKDKKTRELVGPRTIRIKHKRSHIHCFIVNKLLLFCFFSFSSVSDHFCAPHQGRCLNTHSWTILLFVDNRVSAVNG